MGDSINFMMAAAGFNFKKLMRKLKEDVLWIILNTFGYLCKNLLEKNRTLIIKPNQQIAYF